MFDPSNDSKVKAGETKLQLTYRTELQWGTIVFDAAAKTDGLERLVFSMLAGPKKWSGGVDFRMSTIATRNRKGAHYGRDTYPEVWEKTSLIQIGVYLNLHLPPGHPAFLPSRAEDGLVEFNIGLESGDFGLPLIAAEVDTGPLVKALVEVAPGIRKNLIAHREYMSADEFIAIVGKILGIKARRANKTLDDLVPILGPEPALDLAESFAFMKDYGYAPRAEDTLVHPKDQEARLVIYPHLVGARSAP